jgi:hypothetical protein
MFQKIMNWLGLGGKVDKSSKAKYSNLSAEEKLKIRIFKQNNYMSNIVMNEEGVYVRGKLIAAGVYADATIIHGETGGWAINYGNNNSMEID